MAKEKQNKVVNKIKRVNEICTGRTPLGTKPNDECYTNFNDIVREIDHYGEKGYFIDKNIICPCDWDILSKDDPESDGILRIKITYKNGKATISYKTEDDEDQKKIEMADEEEVRKFIAHRLCCNFGRVLTQLSKRYGIKSITLSGYNPATGKGYKFQDVPYDKFDICITNPPFSLYGEFMKCMTDAQDKAKEEGRRFDYILLAPFLNRVSPNVGLPLMLKKCYLGYNIFQKFDFYNPTSKNEYKTKSVCCDWITTFDDAQKERNEMDWKSGINYELYKDEYVSYENITMKDGTHPIRVPAQFPEDYNGWMIGPINVLNKLNTDKYEWYGTNFMKYYNTTAPEKSPFAHKTSNEMMKINGKQGFHGIVFRKKPQE